MKTTISLFITMLMLNCSIAESKETNFLNSPTDEGTINVFASPEVFGLTTKWISEYTALNPKLRFNLNKLADNKVSDQLQSGKGIGFITEKSSTFLNNRSTWNMVVGHDVIVPVMNAANPFLSEVYRKGITPEGLSEILANPDKRNWGILVGNSQNLPDAPLHYYMVNDPSTCSALESFLKTNQLVIGGIEAVSAQEMISAIQKDPNALGFCKLVHILDKDNQKLAEHIKLVPIDKNGNGKIDYIENIYGNLQAFSRGIWIGKYPKALSGNIYSVSSEKPISETEMAFLNWVLTDGQRYLNANGYNDLVLNERQTQLARLHQPVVYATIPLNESNFILKIILIVFFSVVIIGFILDVMIRRLRNIKSSFSLTSSGLRPVFDENSVVIPKGLYFDKTHTWAFMKKDGTVKIGIDDFLQHITGPITRIEMKKAGEKVKKGDHLLTIIQKGKQLNIYSPVSGTIKTQNESLISDSSLLNSAPYEGGWVYTIEPVNWPLEIQFLNMAEKYNIWIKDEFSRLKDFFATVAKTDSPEHALIVMQDGGALKDNVLADLGPEIWEDFQTKFIDNNQIVNFFKLLSC